MNLGHAHKTRFWYLFGVHLCLTGNASVNSSCTQPHPPPLSRADPQVLAFFWPWMANSWGWGLLSCQIPRGGDEKRRQMPCPPSTLQHFSLIAQSNSAVLNFFNVRFFVSSNVFLCNSTRILIKTSCRDDMHQFMVSVLI